MANKSKLEVGDIVIVHNVFLDPEKSRYPVKRIEGNKAITDFRTFNRKIYFGVKVYEFGKRDRPWDNEYVIEKVNK